MGRLKGELQRLISLWSSPNGESIQPLARVRAERCLDGIAPATRTKSAKPDAFGLSVCSHKGAAQKGITERCRRAPQG